MGDQKGSANSHLSAFHDSACAGSAGASPGLSRNPPAAEDEVVLIEHAGLAGGDSTLGDVEFHLRPALLRRRDGRADAGMVVTNLRGDLEGCGRGLPRDPVAAFDGEGVFIQHRFVANDDAVARAAEEGAELELSVSYGGLTG